MLFLMNGVRSFTKSDFFKKHIKSNKIRFFKTNVDRKEKIYGGFSVCDRYKLKNQKKPCKKHSQLNLILFLQCLEHDF